MNRRIKNYIITYSLVIAFIASIVNIRVVSKINESKKQDKEVKEQMRFVLPFLAMVCFFVGCYFAALQVAHGENTGKDRFAGIIYMTVIGLILLVVNIVILQESYLKDYIKGKKYSLTGILMTVGVGAIVFGFLDNFGMKLGTDAMDNTFLQAFLGRFSYDRRFKKYKSNIAKNLKIMNQWVSSDWRKVMNHTLRFEKDIAKIPKMKDLSNAIKKFNGVPLDIPKDILNTRYMTNEYVDNLREKFDLIDGSKAMMGNLFSDCIGALLGAGIVSLFIYMTCYDGTIVSRENDEYTKYLGYVAPIMEGVFIGIGCLMPILLNIAMSDMKGNNNSMACWIIIVIVCFFVIAIMYLSVYLASDMTLEDKKYSIKTTLSNLSERIDLGVNPDETNLKNAVNNFLNNPVLQETTNNTNPTNPNNNPNTPQ